MWSEDIDALLIRARSGEEAGQTELIQAVQKDLQVFVAGAKSSTRVEPAPTNAPPPVPEKNP